jgi:hypothetical protein
VCIIKEERYDRWILCNIDDFQKSWAWGACEKRYQNYILEELLEWGINMILVATVDDKIW